MGLCYVSLQPQLVLDTMHIAQFEQYPCVVDGLRHRIPVHRVATDGDGTFTWARCRSVAVAVVAIKIDKKHNYLRSSLSKYLSSFKKPHTQPRALFRVENGTCVYVCGLARTRQPVQIELTEYSSYACICFLYAVRTCTRASFLILPRTLHTAETT